MIQIIKMTHEEAIRKMLRDDARAAGMIMNTPEGGICRCTFTYSCDVPVNFAKAVLADVIAESQSSDQQKGGAA